MDPILRWNAVALEANRRDFSNLAGGSEPSPEQPGPTLSARALAIVHLAMYDAHAAASPASGLPRYLSAPTPTLPLDAAAAVAGAAHRALSDLFPRQRAHFDAALADTGLGLAHPDAVAFGAEVAMEMKRLRDRDPGAGDAGYVPSDQPCRHRVDPVNPGQGFHAPFYGANASLFAASQRHDLDPPPPCGSRDYLEALREVRHRGAHPSIAGLLPDRKRQRTPEQTAVGLYWAYDGPRELGTPPRLYNLIVREVAQRAVNPRTGRVNGVDENARLFALVNAAMGDAAILAWEQKYLHDLWRPVVGIREHDASMGPADAGGAGPGLDPDCDPEWRPLGAPASNRGCGRGGDFTPPFPAYPSGHATFGAASLHMARMFYGVAPDDCGPDEIFRGPFVSEELDGRTRDSSGVVRTRHARSFEGGLWQMIEENGFSRVWLGVHWSFDAFALKANGTPDYEKDRIGGVGLGLRIARDIFAHGRLG